MQSIFKRHLDLVFIFLLTQSESLCDSFYSETRGIRSDLTLIDIDVPRFM